MRQLCRTNQVVDVLWGKPRISCVRYNDNSLYEGSRQRIISSLAAPHGTSPATDCDALSMFEVKGVLIRGSSLPEASCCYSPSWCRVLRYHATSVLALLPRHLVHVILLCLTAVALTYAHTGSCCRHSSLVPRNHWKVSEATRDGLLLCREHREEGRCHMVVSLPT